MSSNKENNANIATIQAEIKNALDAFNEHLKQGNIDIWKIQRYK